MHTSDPSDLCAMGREGLGSEGLRSGDVSSTEPRAPHLYHVPRSYSTMICHLVPMNRHSPLTRWPVHRYVDRSCACLTFYGRSGGNVQTAGKDDKLQVGKARGPGTSEQSCPPVVDRGAGSSQTALPSLPGRQGQHGAHRPQGQCHTLWDLFQLAVFRVEFQVQPR
jgi:hypothetical protein